MNICTSCTLGIPYSQLLPLFPCFGNLNLNLIGVLVPLTVCSINKTNIFFTLSMKNVLFILDIRFSVTMVTCKPPFYLEILLKNVLFKISHDTLLIQIIFFS